MPNSKGGESRAFDLPLSGALIDLVRQRIEENRIIAADSPWLFPSDSASGHVAGVRVDALGGLVGYALRHLYATLALEADVPIAELKFLLNHSVSSGGVTMGYLHPSLQHLQTWQEKASARILSAIGLVPRVNHWPPRLAIAEAKLAATTKQDRIRCVHPLGTNYELSVIHDRAFPGRYRCLAGRRSSRSRPAAAGRLRRF